MVGAAVLKGEPADRCLVARRASHVPSPGLWEFPGGKVEPGEDPRKALCRELREEMAIAVEVGEHLGQGRIERDGQVLVLDVYEARWIAGEMRLLDHDQARWIEVSEIHSLEWAEADVPVLEALRLHLDGADR